MVSRSATSPVSTRTWRSSTPGCTVCQPVSGGSGVDVGAAVGKGVHVGHDVGEGSGVGVGVGGGRNKEQPDTRSRVRHRIRCMGRQAVECTHRLADWTVGAWPRPANLPVYRFPICHLPGDVAAIPRSPRPRFVARTPSARGVAVFPRRDRGRAACARMPGHTAWLRFPIRE
jgi:hypothetical protein